jgi:hypothetical protein
MNFGRTNQFDKISYLCFDNLEIQFKEETKPSSNLFFYLKKNWNRQE